MNTSGQIDDSNYFHDSNENDPGPAAPQQQVPPEIKAAKRYEGGLELPVAGSTGYASISLQLMESADSGSRVLRAVEAGTAFEVIREEGEWWLVNREGFTGWLLHKYCLINLPDVIPSIIYDNTNTYSSRFASSGKEIPGISNKSLYSGKTYNTRLDREEYLMPVLYTMSKKIYEAQKLALSEGNSLKIYEGFRPYSVQLAVGQGLTDLANKDKTVMAGINAPPWGISWFIVKGVSNHQVGYAIDVGLVKVNEGKEITVGPYTVPLITDYLEYTMPSPIHELSGASAAFRTPVNSMSPTAWKNAAFAQTMNDSAKKLQFYCTEAKLTPLASEWWHFNDLEAKDEVAGKAGNGKFALTDCLSSLPG
ncbi:SH3 domain-containing protein [Paenibacillus mesotrionivorans]|uniref:SH3 domain-containing protein n=1 Tax=Paenibacillus mesotrionivorans TaxID=3160968 RepID=A0ACC7NWC5_9BACL